jgi:hypothetical protein
MDVATVLLPGAQNLASAMLTEAWSAVRGAIARRWGREDADSTGRMAAELDQVRARALAVAGVEGSNPDALATANRRDAALFWAGYLERLCAERPDLAEVIASLPDLTGAGSRSDVTIGHGASQVVHGDVHGSAISVQHVEGGINLTTHH